MRILRGERTRSTCEGVHEAPRFAFRQLTPILMLLTAAWMSLIAFAVPVFAAPATMSEREAAGHADAFSAACEMCHMEGTGADASNARDSRAEVACMYCHVGASAISNLRVYDASEDGAATVNGHTIGAGPLIPDSATSQWVAELPMRGADGVSTVRVPVRQWSDSQRSLYRLVPGAEEDTFVRVGPTELGCLSCHEPHGNPDLRWRPRVSPDPADPAPLAAFSETGYKMLRRYPSGSVWGSPTGDSDIRPASMVKVIEDSAMVGRNVSRRESGEFVYEENGTKAAAPMWVLARAIATDGENSPGHVDPATLSWWCADCHDLDLAGAGQFVSELGFTAHSDRAHPVPFVGGGNGPGQCYSCHRNDLSPEMGRVDPRTGTESQHSPYGDDGCSRCHYGSDDYAQERFGGVYGMDEVIRDADFPHSGPEGSYKMLGDFTFELDEDAGEWSVVRMAITENNLDAVCIRCHPDVGELR